jgi:hypothetical protein
MARQRKRIPSPKTAAQKELQRKRMATVMGVVGGGLKVTRAELSLFIETRLQAFVAEELTPTIEGMIGEVVQPVVAQLVRQILVAQGIIQEPLPGPGQLIGLDGEVIKGPPQLVISDGLVL